jgi:hypothetical protein
MNADKDFKFFIEMRNATVHVRPVIPNKKVSLSIIESTVSVTDSVSGGRVVIITIPKYLSLS